jgi:hypothetical protein
VRDTLEEGRRVLYLNSLQIVEILFKALALEKGLHDLSIVFLKLSQILKADQI